MGIVCQSRQNWFHKSNRNATHNALTFFYSITLIRPSDVVYREWQSFLKNTSGIWILRLQPCQCQQNISQNNMFFLLNLLQKPILIVMHVSVCLFLPLCSAQDTQYWAPLDNSNNKFTLSSLQQFDIIRLVLNLADVICWAGRKLLKFIPVSLAKPIGKRTNIAINDTFLLASNFISNYYYRFQNDILSSKEISLKYFQETHSNDRIFFFSSLQWSRKRKIQLKINVFE